MHAGTAGRGEGEVEEELTRGTAGPSTPTVVLDTNLFVAAFWNRQSASADILSACRDGRVRLYYTQQILREISLILRNIKATERYRQRVKEILDQGTQLQAPGRLSVVADDPEDDKFLECAQLARADYLVTNDDHLLRLRQFDGTKIVKPVELRDVLRQPPCQGTDGL